MNDVEMLTRSRIPTISTRIEFLSPLGRGSWGRNDRASYHHTTPRRRDLQRPPCAQRAVAVTHPALPCQAGEKFRLRLLITVLLGGYLLLCHGCHADVDDEPGLLPDITTQRTHTSHP